MQMRQPTLLQVTDDHFSWLLGERGPPDDGLTEPPGGIDGKVVLAMLRSLTARLHRAGCHSHWLVVDNGEVVGLCGFKRPPSPRGEVEIGYGIAESRRRLGYATAAVALMVARSSRDGVSMLSAETTSANIASQLVLERNGFDRVGARYDDEDGALVLWTKAVSA